MKFALSDTKNLHGMGMLPVISAIVRLSRASSRMIYGLQIGIFVVVIIFLALLIGAIFF